MRILTPEWLKSLNYGELKDFNTQAVGVCIDSREVRNGQIFFAFEGENADGHRFVKNAIDNGAALAVVSREKYFVYEKEWTDFPLWIVPSCLRALHKLASEWRIQFQLPVLNITGSNGKTTTRALIVHLLKTRFKVHSTMGNFNNHLGVPLTLLELNEDYEISVMELGANHQGEIADLCRLTLPTHGLITNVGFAHVGEFGGPEIIASSKLELFECLEPPAIMFINMDDPILREYRPGKGSVISYSLEKKSVDFQGRVTGFSEKGFARISINGNKSFPAPVPGYSGAINTVAAYAVAFSFGLSHEKIVEALKSFNPVQGRMSFREINGILIIDDAYNANPDSAIDSIRTLSLMKTDGRKCVILGDMLELGPWTKEGHERVAQACVDYQIDVLLTVGELSVFTNEHAIRLGHQESKHFKSSDSISEFIQKNFRPGDILLIKGSRDSRMEKIIEALEN